jgi:hypothetical protein
LDVGQQNNVASGFATSQQQLLSVRSPVEIEDSTGRELGYLFGISAL